MMTYDKSKNMQEYFDLLIGNIKTMDIDQSCLEQILKTLMTQTKYDKNYLRALFEFRVSYLTNQLNSTPVFSWRMSGKTLFY